MADSKELVHMLLDETRQGHVFGPDVAFGPIDEDRERRIYWDSVILYAETRDPLVESVREAFPDLTPEECAEEVDHSLTKTVVFGPALAAGEIGHSVGMANLGHTAVGIMCMYIPDQRIDIGDWAMRQAVGLEIAGVPPRLLHGETINARRLMFKIMDRSLNSISPEDAPELRYCFLNNVLGKEAEFFDHSQEYFRRPTSGKDSRDDYMVEHGERIAELSVAMAGYQAVAGILHATFRKDKRFTDLPSVSTIHQDPVMQQNIQAWNTVARVADDRGDWLMDTGENPEDGLFAINPFNVPHPVYVSKLCELAGIHDAAKVAQLLDRFTHFHDGNDGRDATGTFITETFFDQMRGTISTMDPDFRKKYDRYVTLSMRVGEIAWVNMKGDVLMSAIKGIKDF